MSSSATASVLPETAADKPTIFHSTTQPNTTTTKSTQPSIPPGQVNRVQGCLAGVKAGRVHRCWVAGNTVIPYGRQVTLRSSEMGYHVHISNWDKSDACSVLTSPPSLSGLCRVCLPSSCDGLITPKLKSFILVTECINAHACTDALTLNQATMHNTLKNCHSSRYCNTTISSNKP